MPMNYIGSKKSLLGFLERSIFEIVKTDRFSFLDLFAGTGIVGHHFKKMGCKVVANDLQYYSYVLCKNYIENSSNLEFESLPIVPPCTPAQNRAAFVCEYLEALPGKEGFIYNNYCPTGTAGKEHVRLYYSDANGKKADANSEGLMSLEDIKGVMSKRGHYGLFKQEYSRFKADKDTNRDYQANRVTEYLHYVDLTKPA